MNPIKELKEWKVNHHKTPITKFAKPTRGNEAANDNATRIIKKSAK